MQGSHPQAQRSGAIAQHRVLLVDDDAVSLEILSVMLDVDGHEVLRAADGESALNLLAGPDSSTSPDVLLVDMQMPGISGYELARRVRAMEGPKPLLLGMSATALNTQQLAGFDGFLLKPLDLDDLRQALESRRRARVEPPASTPAKPHAVSESGSAVPSRTTGTKRRNRISASAAARREPAATCGEHEGVNWAVLNKLRSAMPPESLRELYAACLTDSRDRAISLRALAQTGNMAEIPRGAHQIKGAASMVGAVRIARLASALELGSCKKEDTLHLFSDLLDACDQLERMLLAGKLDKSNDTSDS